MSASAVEQRHPLLEVATFKGCLAWKHHGMLFLHIQEHTLVDQPPVAVTRKGSLPTPGFPRQVLTKECQGENG
jgi:hypothetical protein